MTLQSVTGHEKEELEGDDNATKAYEVSHKDIT